MISGGMAQVFTEDALGIGRVNVIPFAAVGWAAYILFLVFTAAVSIRMLADERPANPEPAPSPAGQGKKQSKKGKKR
jgi:hypothetical protein